MPVLPVNRKTSRSRSRGAPALPSAENIPSVPLQRDPGVQGLTGSAFGQDIAEGIEAVGRGVGAVGRRLSADADARDRERAAMEKRMADAALRIQGQQDQVESDRSIRDLQKALNDEFKSFVDAEDLSLEESVSKLAANLDDITNNIKTSYRGSEDSRIKFDGLVDAERDRVRDDVAVTSTKLRRGLITDQIISDIDDQIRMVAEFPERLPQALDAILGTPEHEGLVEQRAKSLSLGEEQSFVAAGLSDVTKTAINTLLLKGTAESLASVEALLNDNEAQVNLGPEQSQKFRERVIDIRQALTEDAGEQTKAEENTANLNAYIKAKKDNPNAGDGILESAFGLKAEQASAVQEAFDNIALINANLVKNDKPHLSADKEDRIIAASLGEGFTLAEGAVRKDIFGDDIASNPKPALPIETDLVQGGKLTVEAESEIRRQVRDAVGISIDALGNAVGEQTQQQRDLLVSMSSDVADLVLNKDMGISEAVLIVKMAQPEGTFKETLRFPQAGAELEEIILGSSTTQKESGGVSVEQGIQNINQINQEINSIDFEDATGISSALIAGWNSSAGAIVPSLVNKKVVNARLKLGLAVRGLIQLFTLNPRFAIAEQEVLRGLMPGSGMFNSPTSAATRLGLLNDFIDDRIAGNKFNLKIGLSEKTHLESLDNLGTLFRMKKILRQFDVSFGGGGASITKFSSADQVNNAEKSDVIKSLQSMGRDGFRRFQLDNPEAAEAMKAKARGDAPPTPTGGSNPALPPSFKKKSPDGKAVIQKVAPKTEVESSVKINGKSPHDIKPDEVSKLSSLEFFDLVSATDVDNPFSDEVQAAIDNELKDIGGGRRSDPKKKVKKKKQVK